MKKFALLLLLVFGVAAMAHAQDAATTKTTLETKAKLVCPVTGEDADPDVTFVHEGKTYAFCCEGCVAKFKKDPAKYIKASAKKKYDACDHEGEDHAGHEAKGSDAKMEVKAANVLASGAVINEGMDLSAKIVNEKCPVMGKKVDPAVTTVSYKEKVYGFCCKSCIKKFANNPDKYLD